MYIDKEVTFENVDMQQHQGHLKDRQHLLATNLNQVEEEEDEERFENFQERDDYDHDHDDSDESEDRIQAIGMEEKQCREHIRGLMKEDK